MKNMKKSRRVSWAPRAELCQVKLFLSEDCPSRVGIKIQDHLQAKNSRTLNSNGVDSAGHPPGFEGRHYVNPLKEKLPSIPQIKWRCPAKFVLDNKWLVAAGEESKEAEAQKHRETRVLEAVYPRFSAIPHCPSVSLDVEECHQLDDSCIPHVPLTPIEEEAAADMPSDMMVEPLIPSIISQPKNLPQEILASGNPTTSQYQPPASLKLPISGKAAPETLPSLQPHAGTVPAAELTAITKGSELGSMIDTDLLITILSDPKMIEKLINEHKAVVNPENAPFSRSVPVVPTAPLPSLKHDEIKKSGNKCEAPTRAIPVTMPMFLSKPTLVTSKTGTNEQKAPVSMKNESMSGSMGLTPFPQFGVPTAQRLHRVPNAVQPGLSVKPLSTGCVPISYGSAASVPPVKDIHYYKNLIKLHGERAETQEYHVSQFDKRGLNIGNPKLVQNEKLIQSKLKNKKPCVYFNRSGGCQNGSDCPYQHDVRGGLRPGSMLEASAAKRMRLAREII